jgi:hypothetical protein
VGPLRGQGHCLPCRGQRSAGGARTAGDPVTRVLSPCSLGAAPVGFEGHARRWGWQRRQRWRRRGCERPQASTTEATPPACYHEATPPALYHRSHAPSPLPRKPRPQPSTTEATSPARYHEATPPALFTMETTPPAFYRGSHAHSPRSEATPTVLYHKSHALSLYHGNHAPSLLSRRLRPQPSATGATPPAPGSRSLEGPGRGTLRKRGLWMLERQCPTLGFLLPRAPLQARIFHTLCSQLGSARSPAAPADPGLSFLLLSQGWWTHLSCPPRGPAGAPTPSSPQSPCLLLVRRPVLRQRH